MRVHGDESDDDDDDEEGKEARWRWSCGGKNRRAREEDVYDAER